ncbi:MAG: NAD(P)-binding domain-containing protein [Hyphomicrobiales bacterium]
MNISTQAVPGEGLCADDAEGLPALEARLAADLQALNHPPANWVPPTIHPSGKVADAVVIGGGMCGLAASFALVRRGIRNLRILDRAPAGLEGPWMTSARMETLRSPKELTGPASGLGTLTFRQWFLAQFGRAEWERLYRISRPMWMDYLVWFRRVLDLPVENEVAVTAIAPLDGLLRLELRGAGEPFALCRKLVLATGRAGLGKAAIPDFVAGLPRRLWAHSEDEIDFGALAGKRVAVVGAGASAMDNAAEALEHGAAEVRLLIRRKAMPRINKLMGIGSAGFVAGFPMLPEAWRWRFMHYAGQEQTPAPHNSTLRVSRHPNAFFHFGCGITGLRLEEGELRIDTVKDKLFRADYLILGTGFTVDPFAVPELSLYAPYIASWGERYAPPADLADEELATFPYLGEAFEFLPRGPGAPAGLSDIHCFNHAASLSLGKVSGDIPAISTGANWLAEAIAGQLFCRDVEKHWRFALDYSKPELVGDEWTDAEAG